MNPLRRVMSLSRARADGACVADVGGAWTGQRLGRVREWRVDVVHHGGRVGVRLFADRVEEHLDLGVFGLHERAEVVVREEVAAVSGVAGHHVFGAENAAVDQGLSEGDQRVVLAQIEGHVGGGAVAVEPREVLHVHHRTPLLVAAVGGTPQGGLVHVPEVAAVAGEVLETEALGVGLEVDDAAALFGQGADGDAVVGDQHDGGELPHADGVHRVVQVALGGGAVAHDAHGDAIVDALELVAQGVARSLAQLHAHRTLHRQDAHLGQVEVVDHLSAAAHGVGVAAELLTQHALAEVGEPVELAPHRAQRARAVVSHHPKPGGIGDPGQRQRRSRAVHLFAGSPDGELDLATGHQAHDVLFGGPRPHADPIGVAQLVGGGLRAQGASAGGGGWHGGLGLNAHRGSCRGPNGGPIPSGR